jgi:hypothetical protein
VGFPSIESNSPPSATAAHLPGLRATGNETFADLLIDCEEDRRTLRAVLVRMLRETFR